ncbi:hypothetical protein HDU97_003788 [Phlyctochytrium planicorne]|nr:hypothetical protein HDU97_003788 [Phlyctochytrium planicorne]
MYAPIVSVVGIVLGRWCEKERFTVGMVVPDGGMIVPVGLEWRKREGFKSVAERMESRLQEGFTRLQESLLTESSSLDQDFTILFSLRMDESEDWDAILQSIQASSSHSLTSSTSPLAPAQPLPNPSLQLYLHLDLHERTATALYDPTQLREATLSRLLIHVRVMLESGLQDPIRTPVSKLAMLTETEQKRQAVEWNSLDDVQGRAGDDPGKALHETFEAVAAKMPFRPCVVGTDGKMAPFVAVNRKANRIAREIVRATSQVPIVTSQIPATSLHHLVGTPILLILTPSTTPLDYILASLAILKIGAVVVPLCMGEFPMEWIEEVVRDGIGEGCFAVVCGNDEWSEGSGWNEIVSRLCVKVVRVWEGQVAKEGIKVENEDEGNLAVKVDPASLAYVFYTTRTNPHLLGVQHTHSSILSTSKYSRTKTLLTDRDRLGIQSTYMTISTITSLFAASLVGASIDFAITTDCTVLHVPYDRIRKVPKLPRCRITIVMVSTGDFSETGRDASPQMTPDQFMGMLPGKVLVAYGTVETGPFATCSMGEEEGEGMIGRATCRDGVKGKWRGLGVVVLDGEGGLVATGTKGTIGVFGAGLGKGYRNNPTVTSRRFIRNPYSHPALSSTSLLFLSADTAIQSPRTGSLRLTGNRKVRFTKINSTLLMDVSELEEKIVRDCGVLACFVVKVWGDEAMLVGVVVFRDDESSADPGSVLDVTSSQDVMTTTVMMHRRIQAARTLPRECTPHLFLKARTVVEARELIKDPGIIGILVRPETPVMATPTPTPMSPTPTPTMGRASPRRPLTPNIVTTTVEERKRSALADEVKDKTESPSRASVPTTSTEKVVSPVTPDTVKSPQTLTSPTRPTFSPSLPPLTHHLNAMDTTKQYPLSPLQSIPTPPHVDLVIELQTIHFEALCKSIDAVSRRHGALRSVRNGDGVIVDVGEKVKVVRGGTVRGSGVMELEVARAVSEGLKGRLGTLPIMAWVFEGSGGTDGKDWGVLVMRFGGWIVDSFSLSLFLTDLRLSYSRILQSLSPFPPTPPPFHHVDFAIWHSTLLATPSPADPSLSLRDYQIKFWKESVGSVEGVRVPRDWEGKRGDTGMLRFELDRYLGVKVVDFSRRNRCTINQTYVMAIMALISIWSPKSLQSSQTIATPLILGQYVSLRRSLETASILGPMTNLIALRSDITTETTIQDLVRIVRRMTLSGIEHADVPFTEVSAKSGVNVPQIVVEMVPSLNEGSGLKGIMPSPEPMEKVALMEGVDIRIVMEEARLSTQPSQQGGNVVRSTSHLSQSIGTSGHVVFRSDRFSRETVWSIVAEFLDVLEEIVEGEDATKIWGLARPERVGVTRLANVRREDEVVGAVKEALAEVVGDVGADVDFFDAGGSSMQAIQLSQKLSSRFGIYLPLEQLFEIPTATGISQQIEKAIAERSKAPPPLPQPPSTIEQPSVVLSPVSPKLTQLPSPAYTPRSSTTLIQSNSTSLRSPKGQARGRTLSFESTTSLSVGSTDDDLVSRVLSILRVSLGRPDLQALDGLRESGLTPQLAMDVAAKLASVFGAKVAVYGAGNAMEVARRVREAGGSKSVVADGLMEVEEEEEERMEEPLPKEAGLAVGSETPKKISPMKGSPVVKDISPVGATRGSPFRASSAFDAGGRPMPSSASMASSIPPSSVGEVAVAMSRVSMTSSHVVPSTPQVFSTATSIPRVFQPSDPSLIYPMSPLVQSLHRPRAARQMDLNFPIVVRLRGWQAFGTDALMSALSIVTRRHPILRCVITADGGLKADFRQERVVDVEELSVASTSDPNDVSSMDAVRVCVSALPFDDLTRRSANNELPIRVTRIQCLGEPGAFLLCIVFNAALVDGTSANLVASELLQVLGALTTGDGSYDALAFADEDPTFIDFAAWADACSIEPAPSYARQLEFWEWKLERRLPPLRLPKLDLSPRSELGGSSVLEKVRREIAPAVSARVAVLMRTRAYASSDVLLACLVSLLMRYSGCNDILVGIVAKGRKFSEMDSVVGRFENMVGLRCRVDEGCQATFTDVVAVVKRAKLEAFENTDVPLDVLQQMVGTANPLIQVAFIHNAPKLNSKRINLGDLRVDEWDLPTPPHQNVDLSFHLDDDPSAGLSLSIVFRSDTFSSDTVAAMADHYMRLLETSVNNMDARVGDAAILSNEEIQSLDQVFNASALIPPKFHPTECLHGMFRKVADNFADRPAVTSVAGGVHTFAEVSKASNRLARQVHHSAATPVKGFPIVCLLPRSAGAVITSLAILKLGATCVPVDPIVDDGADWVAEVYRQSGAVLVVTESIYADKLSGIAKESILYLDEIMDELSELDESEYDAGVNEHFPAYALLSRDKFDYIQTTFRTHSGVISDAHWHSNLAVELHHEDRVSLTAPVSSHLFLIESWSALLSGSAAIIFEYGLQKEPEAAMTALAKQEVTVFFTASQFWPYFAQRNWSVALTCRLVAVYGTGLTKGPWKGCHFQMASLFAPTATSGIALVHHLEEKEILPPAGKPISGASCFILDTGRRIMPVDHVGELCIRSDTVFLEEEILLERKGRSGWIGDPLKDGFVYATGILGRWRHDGCLEITGELGDMININGHMVDTGMVRDALLESTDIIDALVTKRKVPQSRDEDLVTYIVPRPGVSIDVTSLINFLRPRLGPMDIPTCFAFCNDGFPRTDAGSIEFSKLPTPFSPFPNGLPITKIGEFMDEQERNVFETVSKVIGVHDFSIHDNIFHIPGSDIFKVSDIVSKLRHIAEAPIPIRSICENPTVSSFSASIALMKQDAIDLGGTIATGEQERDMLLRKDFHTTHLHKQLFGAASGPGRTLLQGLGVVILFIVNIINVAPAAGIIIYFYLNYSFVIALAMLPILYLGWATVSAFTALSMKWIVIGRYRSGTYPIWGFYHFRWWLVDRIHSQHKAYTTPLRGTQFLNLWYYLLGCKIEDRVYIDTDEVTEFDLVTIEEGARIGTGTRIAPAIFENGSLVLRRVRIGKYAEVGPRCTLVAGSHLMPYSTLSPLSTVPYNCTIPAHSHYGGCPLRPVANGQTQGNRDALPHSFVETLFHSVILLGMAIVSGYCLAPSATVIHIMFIRVGLLWAVTVLPVLWLISAIIYALVVIVTRRVSATQMNIHSEVVPLRSSEARRSWFIRAILSGTLLQPFFDHFSGSVVINWFYRALGARIGRNVFIHISTDSLPTLNLLTVGDGAVIIGNGRTSILCETYSSGSVRRAPIVIGEGAVVGAGSVLLPGSTVPPYATVYPRTRLDGTEEMGIASQWVGSPAYPVSDARPEEVAEAIKLRGGRAEERWPWLLLEGVGQLIVPLLVFSLPLPTAFSLGFIVEGLLGPWALLYLAPIGYILFSLAATVVVFMSKWMLVGRIRPDTTAKLHGKRYLGLTIFSALQRYASSLVLDRLKGTEFMAGYWRILGAHVGTGAHIETMDAVEYDLISIGDRAVVGRNAVIMASSVTPQRISFSQVQISSDASVGSDAVVSPGSTIGVGTLVGAGSLVMPGESLTPAQYWEGVPTEGRLSVAGGNVSMTPRGSRSRISSELGRSSTLSPLDGSVPTKRRAGPQNVFLTGATGFVGSHLLNYLLSGDSQVFCLIRATSKEDAMERIRTVMSRFGLWKTSHEYAIVPVMGDLSKPLLGLDGDQWDRLTRTMDVVVHCAAEVDYRKTYDELFITNVEGTRQLLDFSLSGAHFKPFHHISTLSVFNPVSDLRIDETNIPSGKSLHTGYTQSKYVAETLVLNASRSNRPCFIYRLGRITGNSETGTTPPQDLPYMLLKGILGMGSYPIDLHSPVDVVPIDFGASLLSFLITRQMRSGRARTRNSRAKIYHITHPQPTTLPTLCLWLSDLGYSLTPLTYPRWRSHLLAVFNSLPDPTQHPLHPFLPNFESGLADHKWARFKGERTIREAESAGFRDRIVDIDSHLIRSYVSHLVDNGYLPSTVVEPLSPTRTVTIAQKTSVRGSGSGIGDDSESSVSSMGPAQTSRRASGVSRVYSKAASSVGTVMTMNSAAPLVGRRPSSVYTGAGGKVNQSPRRV